MNRFVKPELVRGKSGADLAKLDINKSSNQLSDEKIDIGHITRMEMRKLTPLQHKECMTLGTFFVSVHHTFRTSYLIPTNI